MPSTVLESISVSAFDARSPSRPQRRTTRRVSIGSCFLYFWFSRVSVMRRSDLQMAGLQVTRSGSDVCEQQQPTEITWMRIERKKRNT